jgi:hypothetical protein
MTYFSDVVSFKEAVNASLINDRGDEWVGNSCIGIVAEKVLQSGVRLSSACVENVSSIRR